MANHRIPNEDEAVRWIKDGRTYTWIQSEIQRKYEVRIALSTLSDLRHRSGIPRRIQRDVDLIPWAIAKEHRHLYPVQMLRALSRRRAGEPNPARMNEKLDAWLRDREREGTVVHYELPGGWRYVKRRKADKDVIRIPVQPTTQRRARE